MASDLIRTFGGRWGSALIVAVAAAIGWLAVVTGADAGLDRAIAPARFAALHRVPSDKLVIVEMDAASAAVIRRWPWSRSNYVAVVDRLRAAGAASIVFDVDFSSPSDDVAGDRAFAAALARTDGLVALPTYGQKAGSSDARTIDALPIPMFRGHVSLASVSVTPDADGQIRTMPFATTTVGTPRPSLSAFIAARSGASDATFPIDMALDPAAIPRLSFVAVRDGRFDPAAVRGRNVLIGATAVEMGDRYGTPLWGVIPGVVIQALATETLLNGVPTRHGAALPILLAVMVAMALTMLRRIGRIVGGALLAIVVLIAGALLVQQVLLSEWPLAAALLVVVAAAAGCVARQMMAGAEQQRMVDEPTGLPNMRAFVATPCPASAAIAVCHLDSYDSLCAVLGPPGAATMLRRVADRLALVAIGSVHRVADRQLAFVIAQEAIGDSLDGLRAAMLQPVEVAGRRVDVATSVGVAVPPAEGVNGRTSATLVIEARMAAEDARRADTFWRRAATDYDDLARDVSLMGELDAAIASGQIAVHYQPKCRLSDGSVAGVEALVRWYHPTRGAIGPDQFIPLAERTNRIAQLTLTVLRQVVDDAARWRGAHAHVSVAVNMSAKLLSDEGFNRQVEALLSSCPVPTASLVFEVTESAAMSDPAAAVAALRRYRALGVGISMDDYGTGQSTLTYLRILPLNELKIDRSFVANAHRNHNDAVLVSSTIALAHDLGLRVVAEGVEEADCLEFLRDQDCDLVQGWLTGRPMPLPDLLLRLGQEVRQVA